MCGYVSGFASKWRITLFIFNAQDLFTMALCCYKQVSDLLYKTSLCRCTHASTISSQNMTRCPSKHEKWVISSRCSHIPCNTKVPSKSKRAWFIQFLGSIMEAQLPTKIWPLFWVKSPSIWPKHLQKGPIWEKTIMKNPL